MEHRHIRLVHDRDQAVPLDLKVDGATAGNRVHFVQATSLFRTGAARLNPRRFRHFDTRDARAARACLSNHVPLEPLGAIAGQSGWKDGAFRALLRSTNGEHVPQVRDFRYIRSVLAVVETGSFSAAAQQLNATQPGISQQVRRLEEALGLMLIERSTREAHPTAAGEVFALHCREMLKAHDKVVEQLRRSDRAAGTVVAGVPAWVSGTIAPTVIERFTRSHPGVSVDIMEARPDVLMDHLRRGGLSFAVVSGDDAPAGDVRLFEGEGVLVCRDESRFAPLASPRSLDVARVILPRAETLHRHILERWIAEHGIRPAEVLEVSSTMSTLSLILRSDRTTILPAMVALVEAGPRELGAIRISPAPVLPISVVRARERANVASDQLLRYVEEEIATPARHSSAMWQN